MAAPVSNSARGPYWIVGLPIAAAVAAGGRWLLQGSGNLYTAQAKRFFVPHPDLGWQAAQTERVWLGLDAIGVLGMCALGVALAAYLISRRERARQRKQAVARAALTLGALMSFIVPGGAFVSGGRPTGARDALPAAVPLAQLPDVIDGGLPSPVGTYEVVAAHSTLVAKLEAGKEAFDAAFAGAVSGTLSGDLANIGAAGAPIEATFTVPVNVIDTGISMRNGHAKEYFHADEFPTISFALGAFTATRIASPTSLQVRASGTLTLMGQAEPVVFSGTIGRLDGAAMQRLGLAAAAAALIIEGSFSLKISETGLAAHQSSFDRDELPVLVTLVLRHVAAN
ncbi:MAG: YceI family protein [Myxococcales bacterium]|nr:YceI family protein [Myxococcales bacterium]